MTAKGRKRAPEAAPDGLKNKKRMKLGNTERNLENSNQISPSNENNVNDTAYDVYTKDGQASPSAEVGCDECLIVPTCSLACNVSCDGSDDCTAPEPCNDPLCEGDPCWEDDCEKYECTDQSCRANQCRIEPCSQATCFEDIDSLNNDFTANISNPCWDVCQIPNQLLCLQDCIVENSGSSRLGSTQANEQAYSSCSTQNWEEYPFSHLDLPRCENIQSPSLQLRMPPVSYANRIQSTNYPIHGTSSETSYPSYDLNDLIAVTSCPNLNTPLMDNDSRLVEKTVKSQAVYSTGPAYEAEYRNYWPSEKDFEALARPSASTSYRLSTSTTASSPLDMIAAAAEISAGVNFPHLYFQQHSDGQTGQMCSEIALLHPEKSGPTTQAKERTPSGNGNTCFCKWKTKKDDESGKLGLCNREFSTEEALWIHVKSDHTSTLINKYTCQWHGCARPGHFGTKSKLERHLLPHTGYKEHKCPICSAAFSLKQQVENHIRIHTGDTPFKCDECGQTFRTAQARDDHKRRHRGVKQFKCRVCGLACTDASNRSKHERTHRLEAYQCRHKGCTAKAKRWDNIKRHFEHMGHCLELLHDPIEQRKYKKEAEAATKVEE